MITAGLQKNINAFYLFGQINTLFLLFYAVVPIEQIHYIININHSTNTIPFYYN